MKHKAAKLTAILAALSLTFAGCSSDTDSTANEPLSEEDETVYNIGIVQTTQNNFQNEIILGFTDALEDTIGADHVNITTQVITDDRTGSDIVSDYAASDIQLIMTTGEKALAAADETTEEIPIVGTAVADFQSTLHILTEGQKSWNKETGTNITGISSAPNMSDTLSLIIEATPDLQTVGILYSPEDDTAIFLNERLENYLDQAGIPWKEYAVTSTEAAINSQKASEYEAASVITPSKTVMYSAKEGVDIDVYGIGDDGVLSGVIDPSAVHTAAISEYWYGGKGTVKPSSYYSNNGNTENYVTALESDASTEEVIAYAAAECSALYISSGSMLTDQAELIGEIASAAGVSTIAGDPDVGVYTLATLYTDAYNQGYQAGKEAYDILVEGTDPGSIAIKGINRGAEEKLYNAEYAEMLGITFPKSFSEITEYLESYTPGDLTDR